MREEGALKKNDVNCSKHDDVPTEDMDVEQLALSCSRRFGSEFV